MKKLVVGVIAAALLAVGAWFFASPVLAMKGLKEAAVAGDRDELKERVDFPAIRESMKSQVRSLMVAELAKEKESNPFAGLGMAIASAMIDPMIDAMISPDGIKVMVENGRMKNPNGAAADPANDVEWSIERKGFDRFIARPETDDKKAPRLTFRRDGLGWDLVDIEMPQFEQSKAEEGGA